MSRLHQASIRNSTICVRFQPWIVDCRCRDLSVGDTQITDGSTRSPEIFRWAISSIGPGRRAHPISERLEYVPTLTQPVYVTV